MSHTAVFFGKEWYFEEKNAVVFVANTVIFGANTEVIRSKNSDILGILWLFGKIQWYLGGKYSSIW